MRNLILILFIAFIGGCKGLETIKPNNLMFGTQCINKKPIAEITPYRHLAFYDGFDNAIPGDTCYSQKPKCALRLDWNMGGDCPFDETKPAYSGLKNLNKCVWKPWEGYNYWNTTKQMTFHADAVEVSNGSLKLKVLANPYFDPTKGTCGAQDPSAPAEKFFNVNCPLMTGAVDSLYLDSQMKGRNALYGRIEMKARLWSTTAKSSYPALWMWPGRVGVGYPFNPTSADLNTVKNEPRVIGEIDILESDGAKSSDYIIQSYHNWEFGVLQGSAYLSEGRAVKLGEFHTYGVEWSPTSIKYYIDDCYTYEIKQGQKSTNGRANVPMKISDTASFIMMTIGGGSNGIDSNNRDVFEIDEVRIYD